MWLFILIKLEKQKSDEERKYLLINENDSFNSPDKGRQITIELTSPENLKPKRDGFFKNVKIDDLINKPALAKHYCYDTDLYEWVYQCGYERE